jgi:glutathione peroxidase-family protein
VPLSKFKGNVLLIVNVACKCGYTLRNYDEMAKLLEKYYDQGLRVLLFPSNQFAGQEPGTPQEIKDFIQVYSSKFDIFEKCKVNGSDAIPLFQFLKNKCHGTLIDAVKWNFTKFLVNRDGMPVHRYASGDYPLSFEDKIKELL